MAQGFANPPGEDADNQRIALRLTDSRTSATELALLATTGGLATLAMAAIHLSLRTPGHAILKATLPIAIGLTLVPRRHAGSVIGASAAMFAGLLMVPGWGEIHLSALTGLVLLGPALDLAARGVHSRRALVARFAVAGLAVNMLAMGVKLIAIPLGLEAGGRGFAAKWPASAFSFALCGALAGLVGAAVCLTWARRRRT